MACLRGAAGATWGNRVTDVHEGLDLSQSTAQIPARMQMGKVFRRKAAVLEERHGERITESQRSSGRRGGRQIERARLFVDGGDEVDVRALR